MSARRLVKTIVILSAILVVFCLIGNPFVAAQTWEALPPYNFLWPLWSPALSPVDPVTGLKTPIISSLYPSTILPLQPGLVWNPAFTDPYFLYNSPIGLQYYDVIYGINPWPPTYSLDPLTGLPIPLNLPVGYQYLSPTDSTWLQTNLPLANLAYLAEYPTWALAAYNSTLPPNLAGLDPYIASLTYPTPALSSLLTYAQILGYAPVTTPAISVVAPTTSVLPATTVIPPPVTVAPAAPFVTPTPTAPVVVTSIFPGSIFLALTLLGLL